MDGGMCLSVASTQAAAFLQPAVVPRPPSLPHQASLSLLEASRTIRGLHPSLIRPLKLEASPYQRPLPNCEPLFPALKHTLTTTVGVKSVSKCNVSVALSVSLSPVVSQLPHLSLTHFKCHLYVFPRETHFQAFLNFIFGAGDNPNICR